MLPFDNFSYFDLKNLFYLTTNIAQLGIWIWDAKTNHVEYNSYIEQIYGFKNSETISKETLFKCIYPEDIIKVENNWNKLLSKSYPTTIEYRIFRSTEKDMKCIKAISDIICDHNGDITYVRNVNLDITEYEFNKNLISNYVSKLEKAIYSVIDVITAMTEIRDPYTAGHEQRVSLLSAEIAKYLDFTEWQIQGIIVGSQVHDIGKIFVSSEILSRPGKLSPILLELIKMHSEIGHKIMKNVDLPWKVSNIILQHHERLDGSGYPNCLTSNNIDLETKIISVADVVEAMSSHRPYRPSLGIDLALQEIYDKRDILYCKDVVDVCIDLFTKRNFKLPDIKIKNY